MWSFTSICSKFATFRLAKNLHTSGSRSQAEKLISARLVEDKVHVEIKDDNNKHLVFPSVWLRDNCQCSKCFHKPAKSRLSLMRNLDIDVKPRHVSIQGEKLSIKWPDEHESLFDWEWLSLRDLTKNNVSSREAEGEDCSVQTWDSRFDLSKRILKFSDIMNSEAVYLHWLNELEIFGLTLIEGLGPASLSDLVKSFGIPKPTHYRHLSAESGQDADNIASNALGLHLDLPFCNHNPGLQFVHCIEQHHINGGENEFVDGFHLAKVIRASEPDFWKLLTQVDIEFWGVGQDDFGEFHKRTTLPTIQLDKSGQPFRLNYNNQVRGSHLSVRVLDEIKEVYGALFHLDKLAYDPQHMITYKMAAGQCVVFNNQRILHGRKEFESGNEGYRKVTSCYLDWDEVRSKRNVLIHRND